MSIKGGGERGSVNIAYGESVFLCRDFCVLDRVRSFSLFDIRPITIQYSRVSLGRATSTTREAWRLPNMVFVISKNVMYRVPVQYKRCQITNVCRVTSFHCIAEFILWKTGYRNEPAVIA